MDEFRGDYATSIMISILIEFVLELFADSIN